MPDRIGRLNVGARSLVRKSAVQREAGRHHLFQGLPSLRCPRNGESSVHMLCTHAIFISHCMP